MSREEYVKILVVGPSKVGKSTVADFLSGTRDRPYQDYKETNPCRILETSVDGLNIGGGRRIGRGTRANVELWDVGGSHKAQNTWTGISYQTDGIIFVFNPDVKDQERELEFWHKKFAMDTVDVPPSRCLIFSHRPAAGGGKGEPTPRITAPPLASMKLVETSIESSEYFKDAFEKLIEKVLTDRREEEENAAMTNDVMAGAVVVGAGH